ncbi:hypothetical protein ACTD5D_29990 [Nocardia takedensis]|uniref:hypothetical protein n=1 Tax=Nocardia takedensis TaxID=259390 RepID=UPI0002DAE39A|nr:hypothetical protein [Nocardia takedensis]
MSKTGKRVLAYLAVLAILAAAVQYGHTEGRSAVAVLAAVLVALVVFEATARRGHGG